MILSAQTIRSYCTTASPLLTPFTERGVFMGKSYGLSCHGYDIRVAEDAIIRSKEFMLASSIERFDMPIHLAGFVKDKSSWARMGLTVQNTVIEAGWAGYLTLELINHSEKAIELVRGMPIAQIIFQYLDKETAQPYKGKYQNQEAGPQAARDEK